jgi:hypothetical protein
VQHDVDLEPGAVGGRLQVEGEDLQSGRLGLGAGDEQYRQPEPGDHRLDHREQPPRVQVAAAPAVQAAKVADRVGERGQDPVQMDRDPLVRRFRRVRVVPGHEGALEDPEDLQQRRRRGGQPEDVGQQQIDDLARQIFVQLVYLHLGDAGQRGAGGGQRGGQLRQRRHHPPELGDQGDRGGGDRGLVAGGDGGGQLLGERAQLHPTPVHGLPGRADCRLGAKLLGKMHPELLESVDHGIVAELVGDPGEHLGQLDGDALDASCCLSHRCQPPVAWCQART